MLRIAAAVALCAFGSPALRPQDDKIELRYKFQKGETIQIKARYAMSVKLDEVPEAYQGLIAENPLDLQFEGQLQFTVMEIGEDRKATLEGRWEKMRVKGNIVLSRLDYDYDAQKKDEKPAKKEEKNSEIPGFGDMEENLKAMAASPVRMTVEPNGRLTVHDTARRGLTQITAQFLSFNGLMGPFPKGMFGRGESWKGEEKIGMPSVGRNVEVKILGENTCASRERVGDRDCMVIKSKYTVAAAESEEKKPKAPGQGFAFSFKIKATGEGEGTSYFCPGEGRPIKSSDRLKGRVTASVPNAGGGNDIEIRATLKIDRSHEIPR